MMKSVLTITVVCVVSLFTFIPKQDKLKEVKIQKLTFNSENSQTQLIISKIDTIEKEKKRIYSIQQELMFNK